MTKDIFESVPEITQLVTLPFLAGIAGVLAEWGNKTGYRVTLHRTMCRHEEVYLQQIVNYFSSDTSKQKGGGRILAVDTGIVGAAFRSRMMHHTQSFETEAAHMEALKEDLEKSGELHKFDTIAISYLAIPFLGIPDSSKHDVKVVEKTSLAILYAECFGENIFADDALLKIISQQCREFAIVLDKIGQSSPDHVKNFSYPIYDKTHNLSGDEAYKLNSTPDARYPCPVLGQLRSLNLQFV